MNFILNNAAAFLCAVLSALGMGGGGILLIYLTVLLGFQQQNAQGVNLIFFMPVAITAIIIHAKKGLIKWKLTLKCILPGIAGVYFGWKLAMFLESVFLSKLFGGFLLIIGIRELFINPDKRRAESEN